MDQTYLQVSDGNGDAALMHITNSRSIGATTIAVDTVSNIPSKFIATYGSLLPSGFIDPSTAVNFYGHLSGSDLEIDGFLAGSTDNGNEVGDVVVIRPNTFWANFIGTFLANVSNDDALALADDVVDTAQIADGAVGTDQIEDEAITNDKIGDGEISEDKLDTFSATTDANGWARVSFGGISIFSKSYFYSPGSISAGGSMALGGNINYPVGESAGSAFYTERVTFSGFSSSFTVNFEGSTPRIRNNDSTSRDPFGVSIRIVGIKF